MPGNAPPADSVDVVQMAQEASSTFPDHEVSITYTETEAADTDSHSGGTAVGESKKSFGRFLSWFGLSANEAASYDKGITSNGISLGRAEGYGIFERFCVWVRSWAITLGVLALLLAIACFLPVVGPIAQNIVRFIFSLIPGLSSITERMWANAQLKKPLQQVVAGGQKFKERVDVEVFVPDAELNAKIIKRVRELFTLAQTEAQPSELTRRVVAELK